MIIRVKATLVSEPKFRSYVRDGKERIIAEVPIALNGSYFILHVPADQIDKEKFLPGSDIVFPVYIQTKGGVFFARNVEVVS